MVQEMWPKCRPRLVRSLKKQGRLEEEMKAAAERADHLFEGLLARGLQPFEANHEAVRQNIVLPDLPRPGEPIPENGL